MFCVEEVQAASQPASQLVTGHSLFCYDLLQLTAVLLVHMNYFKEVLTVRVHQLLLHVESLKLTKDDKQISQLLDEGNKLLDKCYKLPKRKIGTRYIYAKKLIQLERTLYQSAGLKLQENVQIDIKRILNENREIHEKLNKLSIGRSHAGPSAQLYAFASTLPLLPSIAVGLHLPVEELKAILFQTSHQFIGVCAPGGCGKTVLVTKLCQDVTVIAKFKEVIFLNVSKTPNVVEIVRMLWARLIDRNNMPTFDNVEDVVRQFNANLGNITAPILIILDDVWSESLLDKLMFKRSAYIRTIITSRATFKLFDSIYRLKMLEKKDAVDLFAHYASTENGEHAELMEKIVDGCKGYPLLLKVIGSSLRKQPSGVWRMMASVLKEGSGRIFDVHDELLHCLSTSLDSLNHMLLDCFMDLGSFPADKKIPVAALLDIWTEIRGLREDDGYFALLELANRNLIELIERRGEAFGGENPSFRDLYVTQHPLLRDLAVYYSKKSNPCFGNTRLFLKQKEDGNWINGIKTTQASMAQLVSIDSAGDQTMSDMSFEHAEVIILNINSAASTFTLPAFMEKMKNLKVLIITNYGSRPKLLNNLLSLHLPQSVLRIRLEKVAVPLMISEVPLPNLKKLTMVSCELSHYADTKVEMAEVLPSLLELEVDYGNDLSQLPAGICNITTLQKVSITNCPDLIQLPDEIGNLGNLESLSLQACVSLKYLPDSICELKNLEFLDVSHCSGIEELPEEFGKLSSLKMIDMRRCFQLTELTYSVKMMQRLEKVICDEDTANIWKQFKLALPTMELSILREAMNLNWLA